MMKSFFDKVSATKRQVTNQHHPNSFENRQHTLNSTSFRLELAQEWSQHPSRLFCHLIFRLINLISYFVAEFLKFDVEVLMPFLEG